MSSMSAPPAKCSACPAAIRWALTAKNAKPIPLDYAPNADGNIILEEVGARGGLMEERARPLTGLELELARTEGRTLWMPHHATCPKADAFRTPLPQPKGPTP